MTVQKPFVTVCVASYNRVYIIEECIEALLLQSYPKDRYEVVVVDNNSSDGTVELLIERFKSEIDAKFVKIKALEMNTGSSGSYIHGLEASNPNWDYFLKMDEDLILQRSCLLAMVNCAVAHSDTGMVGGKVLLYKYRDTFHGIGSYLRPYFAIAKGIGVNKTDNGQYNVERSLEGLNGCMILISRKLKDKVGWFDKDYFLYYDDHDLMIRSLRSGFRHYYTPDAVGYHDTKTSGPQKFSNTRWIYYSSRGAWMLFYKNYNFASFQGLLYILGIHVLYIRAFFFILLMNRRFSDRKKNLRALWRSYFDGLLRRRSGFVKVDV